MVWLNAKIHMGFVFKHQLEIIWTKSPYEDIRGLQYWSQDCPAVLHAVLSKPLRRTPLGC